VSRKRVRFGLVGAGSIAQAYAQAFESSEFGELVAVADTRETAARSLAEGLKCKSFTSYTEMFDEVHPEAVIIATPPITHPEIAIYFLEKGVHVLCEKPISVDLQSAKKMQEASIRSGSILTMASKFRYVDDVIRAKSIVASGLVGDIVLFENAFTSRVQMGSRWNSDPKISGGGVLIDNGTHSVDIMRYFLGPIAEVQVIEGKRSQGLSVDETIHMFVKSTNGVMGTIDLSWSINKELDSFINIYGTAGTVSVGWKESKYKQTSGKDWVVFGKGYQKVQAFGSQIKNFSLAVRGEEQLLITMDDAIASVEVIESAYRALNSPHWISVENRSVVETVNGNVLLQGGLPA
jgi:predicted dehydrogenase